MNATIFVQAATRHRRGLTIRWERQFQAAAAAAGIATPALPAELVPALFDDAMAAFDPDPLAAPTRALTLALARLADFPRCVQLCIELHQAGEQVLGAFIVENAGPRAAWGRSLRNRLLGELDAVFHLLVHRQVEALGSLTAGFSRAGRPARMAAPRLRLAGAPASVYRRN